MSALDQAAATPTIWSRLLNPLRDAYGKQSYPLGYSPGLDGFRGLMTIGTMTSHIHHPFVPGSILFMDIFYVLSGYFITGLLIRDVRQHGSVRFAAFYKRRFSRLLPPLAAMISTFLIVGYFLLPSFKAVAIDAAIGFGYVANWWRAFLIPGLRFMGHTWSLAVEEQFYIIWPLAFLLMFRCFGIGWRMVGAIGAIAMSIWAWRIWLTWHSAETWGNAAVMRLYNGFDTRADALMVGCALAVILALIPLTSQRNLDKYLKVAAWPVGICFVTCTFAFVHWEERFYYYAGSMVLGSGMGVLIMIILMRPIDTVLHRVLERRELVFLGRIFYALYLWHYPIFLMMYDAGWPAWKVVAVGYPLTFAFAVASYVFIERHFMRAKARAA